MQSVQTYTLLEQLLLLPQCQLGGYVELAEIFYRACPLLLPVVFPRKVVLLERHPPRMRPVTLSRLLSVLAVILVLLATVLLGINRCRGCQRYIYRELYLVNVVLVIRLLLLLLLRLRLCYRHTVGGGRYSCRRALKFSIQMMKKILPDVAAHAAVKGTVELRAPRIAEVVFHRVHWFQQTGFSSVFMITFLASSLFGVVRRICPVVGTLVA